MISDNDQILNEIDTQLRAVDSFIQKATSIQKSLFDVRIQVYNAQKCLWEAHQNAKEMMSEIYTAPNQDGDHLPDGIQGQLIALKGLLKSPMKQQKVFGADAKVDEAQKRLCNMSLVAKESINMAKSLFTCNPNEASQIVTTLNQTTCEEANESSENPNELIRFNDAESDCLDLDSFVKEIDTIDVSLVKDSNYESCDDMKSARQQTESLKSNSNRSTLKDFQPEKSHRPANLFECDMCSYHSKWYSHVKKHRNTHFNQKEPQCMTCVKQFARKTKTSS